MGSFDSNETDTLAANVLEIFYEIPLVFLAPRGLFQTLRSLEFHLLFHTTYVNEAQNHTSTYQGLCTMHICLGRISAHEYPYWMSNVPRRRRHVK